ncbi:MFS transporter [Rhizobium sp. Leaf384]|uniref:MFS transporter n=1 Tax=Rhizobium sp. Leaf384 TaxID=1736358 RepID=UPI000715EF14|nr:MFS transporter [Rhizobium sp. Leaf384]KQS75164.1 MFS transporter [Rhizobium sp. Leaf384]
MAPPHDLNSARRSSGFREQWATRATFLVVGSAMAAWAPLVPVAKQRIGLDESALGLLLLCLGLGSLVSMPLVGMLANRFGCRAVIIASSLATACALPVLAVADTVPVLAVALAIFGASVGAVDVAVNIQAVMVEKDSGRNMMSGFHGLFSVGGIVGAGGISLILGAGWMPVIAACAISCLVLALLIVSIGGLLPYGNQEMGDTPLFVLPRGIVAFIGMLCFLVFLSEGAVLDWSAILLIERHDVDQSSAGYGYAVFAAAMTAGRLSGDWIVRTFGGMRVVVLGGAIAAAGFLLAVFAPSQSLAYLGFLIVGAGAANIVPVLFTAAGRQTLMPPSLAISSITTLGYAGILAGPAAIGFLAHHLGIAAAFTFVAAGLVFVSVSWPFTRRNRS